MSSCGLPFWWHILTVKKGADFCSKDLGTVSDKGSSVQTPPSMLLESLLEACSTRNLLWSASYTVLQLTCSRPDPQACQCLEYHVHKINLAGMYRCLLLTSSLVVFNRDGLGNSSEIEAPIKPRSSILYGILFLVRSNISGTYAAQHFLHASGRSYLRMLYAVTFSRAYLNRRHLINEYWSFWPEGTYLQHQEMILFAIFSVWRLKSSLLVMSWPVIALCNSNGIAITWAANPVCCPRMLNFQIAIWQEYYIVQTRKAPYSLRVSPFCLIEGSETARTLYSLHLSSDVYEQAWAGLFIRYDCIGNSKYISICDTRKATGLSTQLGFQIHVHHLKRTEIGLCRSVCNLDHLPRTLDLWVGYRSNGPSTELQVTRILVCLCITR